jgi:hypothetical protein
MMAPYSVDQKVHLRAAWRAQLKVAKRVVQRVAQRVAHLGLPLAGSLETVEWARQMVLH